MSTTLRAGTAGSVPLPPGDAQSQHVAIEALEACRRLAAEFPDVDPQEIEVLMGKALDHTLSASVETFRVLLAERSTRARLRALTAHQER
jgi:hypothetical protein